MRKTSTENMNGVPEREMSCMIYHANDKADVKIHVKKVGKKI